MAKKLPTKAAECADLLYTMQAARAKLSAKVSQAEEAEKELKRHILELLKKSKATEVAGRRGRVELKTVSVPTIKAEDWPKLFAYMAKHQAWELVQRRLSTSAALERLEGGEKLPVKLEKFATVNCRKA